MATTAVQKPKKLPINTQWTGQQLGSFYGENNFSREASVRLWLTHCSLTLRPQTWFDLDNEHKRLRSSIRDRRVVDQHGCCWTDKQPQVIRHGSSGCQSVRVAWVNRLALFLTRPTTSDAYRTRANVELCKSMGPYSTSREWKNSPTATDNNNTAYYIQTMTTMLYNQRSNYKLWVFANDTLAITERTSENIYWNGCYINAMQ